MAKSDDFNIIKEEKSMRNSFPELYSGRNPNPYFLNTKNNNNSKYSNDNKLISNDNNKYDAEKARNDNQRFQQEFKYFLKTTNDILKNNNYLIREQINLQERSLYVLEQLRHNSGHGGGGISETLKDIVEFEILEKILPILGIGAAVSAPVIALGKLTGNFGEDNIVKSKEIAKNSDLKDVSDMTWGEWFGTVFGGTPAKNEPIVPKTNTPAPEATKPSEKVQDVQNKKTPSKENSLAFKADQLNFKAKNIKFDLTNLTINAKNIKDAGGVLNKTSTSGGQNSSSSEQVSGANFTGGGSFDMSKLMSRPGEGSRGLGLAAGGVDPSFNGKPASGSQNGYYNRIYNSVYEAAKAKGLPNPEVIARLGATQSSLETGYGKHMVGNNAFGIKGVGTAGTSSAGTSEFINGRMVSMSQGFRRYNSIEESAGDYIDFLMKNKRYHGVLGAKTIDEAIEAQARTGYATDPNYGAKLSAINSRNSTETGARQETPSMGPEKVKGDTIIPAVEKEKRAFKNTGTITLPDPETKELRTFNFVTGGGGRGSAPTGIYDIDPNMMRGGSLGDRWVLTQKGQRHDTAWDPEQNLTRYNLRIHQAHGQGTLGCIGILGGSKVYEDFQRRLIHVISQGKKVSLNLGTQEAQTILDNMTAPSESDKSKKITKDEIDKIPHHSKNEAESNLNSLLSKPGEGTRGVGPAASVVDPSFNANAPKPINPGRGNGLLEVEQRKKDQPAPQTDSWIHRLRYNLGEAIGLHDKAHSEAARKMSVENNNFNLLNKVPDIVATNRMAQDFNKQSNHQEISSHLNANNPKPPGHGMYKHYHQKYFPTKNIETGKLPVIFVG